MPYCRKCGSPMPEEALFCPNCGAPVEQKAPIPSPLPEEKEGIKELVMAGALGVFLSVLVSAFWPNSYFVPAFLASLAAIYAFRIQRLKEALITALMIYLFADGILASLILGTLYYTNTPLEFSLLPSLWDVLSYTISPLTAFLAGYLGAKISPKRRPRREKGPGGVIYSL